VTVMGGDIVRTTKPLLTQTLHSQRTFCAMQFRIHWRPWINTENKTDVNLNVGVKDDDDVSVGTMTPTLLVQAQISVLPIK